MAAFFKQGISLKISRVTPQKVLISSLILLGSTSWLLTTIKNGLFYSYGLGFWGPNGHDGIWHLSLISELKKNIPPTNPIYSGESLQNYHFFFDFLVAQSSNLFSIDSQDLLFRFFPVLISLLAGVLIYQVVKKMFDENSLPGFFAGVCATFFLYFGGSFGWVVSYFRNKDFGGETMFWSQQGISTLLNPPFAISVVLFLAGFLIFVSYFQNLPKLSLVKILKLEWLNRENIMLLIPLILLWGSLIEFKAYAGVLCIGALILLTLDNILRKSFALVPLTFFTSLISLIIFIPSLGSSSLFVVAPFWLVTSMINFQDRLSWQRLALAIQSESLFKIIAGHLIGITIFLLGNLGTRIVAFLNIKDFLRYRLLTYFAILGLILPLIFIQKGTNWNIVQFFYYTQLSITIFTGLVLGRLAGKFGIKKASVVFLLLIFLTIPTTINTASQYLPERPPAKLSNSEYKALQFLKGEPQGTVLSLAYDKNFRNKYSEPLPLAVYESTSYVSAFSGQPGFIEDTVNLDILGIDYKGRLNSQRDFARIKEHSKKILEENNIKYIYMVKKIGFEENESLMGIKKIFENDEVKIFKIDL